MDIITSVGPPVVNSFTTEDLFFLLSMSLVSIFAACAKILKNPDTLTPLQFFSELFNSVFCGIVTVGALLGQPWIEFNYYAIGAITGYVSYKGPVILDEVASLFMGRLGIPRPPKK